MTAPQKTRLASPYNLRSLAILLALFAPISNRNSYCAANEWHDALWFVKADDHPDERNEKYIQLEGTTPFVRFGERSDLDAKKLPESANQPFKADEYRLFWGDIWPEIISIDVPPKDADKFSSKTTYYLSVADPKTAPRLELTTDRKKANRWKMESTRFKNGGARGFPRRDHWGYIRVTDIPGLELWLGISSEPILKNHPITVVEYRRLTISAKKEHVFHFSHSIPDGK